MTRRPSAGASRRLVLALACALVLAAGCAGADRPIAPAAPADQLRIARLRYERHDYLDAIELLKGYIQYQTGASDLDEAHFLLGMCYLARKEWPLAAGEFVILTSDFPDSPHLADAHYWLAMSYWRQARPAALDQDPTRRAIAQWDRFLALYPDHPRADEARRLRLEARSRLAEKAIRNGRLYLTLKHWRPAIYYFDLVARDYADTPWLDDAWVGKAEALKGDDRPAEARTLLEDHLSGIQDPDLRDKARDLLHDLGDGSRGAAG